MATAWNTRDERLRVTHKSPGPSRTKQAPKEQIDINEIVRRHAQTGMWDHLNPRAPVYGDFSHASDLQEALERVRAATADFEALPAKVRGVADNDPVRFLALLASEEGAQALADAGLPIEGVRPSSSKAAPAAAPPAEPAPSVPSEPSGGEG